jgi:hypothetical protein
MSKKQNKTIEIILPSGRTATIAVPKKAKSAEAAQLSLLGTVGKFCIYEKENLEVVIVEAEIESLVKGVGPSTLKTLFETTNMTPELAVSQGVVKYVHNLPESGFYVLQGGTHKWVVEEEKETKTTENELM